MAIRVGVKLGILKLLGFVTAGGGQIRLDIGWNGSQHFSRAQTVELHSVFVPNEGFAIADGTDFRIETELLFSFYFWVIENDTSLVLSFDDVTD